MFGILVVKDINDSIGFLCAYSGNVTKKNNKIFVPPVFELISENSFYLEEEKKISKINLEVNELENSQFYIDLLSILKDSIKIQNETLCYLKTKFKSDKILRKNERDILLTTNKDVSAKIKELDNSSIKQHYQIKNIKLEWKNKILNIKNDIDKIEIQLNELKLKRKLLSRELQERIFRSYNFSNIKKESKSLIEIFDNDIEKITSGAGECCAPKLLQYAFTNNYKPIAMAEFWWGKPPLSEIRQHKHFYPSCKSKCLPILGHMLDGMILDKNPLKTSLDKKKEIRILYIDKDIVVVNKPEDILSVPGKNIQDCVYERIIKQIDNPKNLYIVHRLDMSTSGVMIFARNLKVQSALQRQFENREVKKKYIAILDGQIDKKEGIIDLPLRLNFEESPRQIVCFDSGKQSITHYRVISQNENSTIELYPKTGRTHQLRVHCAHYKGLGVAILGDELYGRRSKRLYLHAEELVFWHPILKKEFIINVKANF